MEHMIVSPELVKVVAAWCKGVQVEEIDPFDAEKRYPALNIQTREGVKRASVGDTVVKHDDGSFSVMSPLAFHDLLRES